MQSAVPMGKPWQQPARVPKLTFLAGYSVLGAVGVREASADGLVYEYHVVGRVPAVWVVTEGEVLVDLVRPLLCKYAQPCETPN